MPTRKPPQRIPTTVLAEAGAAALIGTYLALVYPLGLLLAGAAGLLAYSWSHR